MGNLLGLRETFLWHDNAIDRNNYIDNLNLAIVEARNYGDEIYGSPNFSQFDAEWEDFMTFIYQTMYDDEARINRFPWLNQLQHTTLIRIFDFFQNTTPLLAVNQIQLQDEFPNANNGSIGCFTTQLPNGVVHDIISWNEFHRQFVSNLTLQNKRENYDYFIAFYKPELKKQRNQIQQLINEGHVHNSITRIDAAHTVFDKIHIHFNNNENCALNIDGTWRHEDERFNIPLPACSLLDEWGFLLPHEYYQL